MLNLLQGQTTGVICLHTETSNTFFVHKTSIIAFLKEKIPHVQVKSSEYLILQKNLNGVRLWGEGECNENTIPRVRANVCAVSGALLPKLKASVEPLCD